MVDECYKTGETIIPYAIRKCDYHDWDNYVSTLELKEPQNGLVPDSTFFALDEGRNILVGAVNIRHYLNEALLLNGGHIGDGVRPSERRKGYATQMIALALEECRKLGICRVLMVCDKDNIGSAKSIMKNGGVLENEIEVDGVVEQRYWIELPQFHVRRFEESDAEEVSALIRKTLKITNSRDYSEEYIEKEVALFSADYVIGRASWTNFYLVCDGKTIVGTGAIGPYWGKEDESSLFTIFVLPEYQGKGIGRKIIETLEKDEFFFRAKRIEIPASITACQFYRKMGYNYKNGIDVVDEEQLYRLEKFR